jgi:hypothetical protein
MRFTPIDLDPSASSERILETNEEEEEGKEEEEEEEEEEVSF